MFLQVTPLILASNFSRGRKMYLPSWHFPNAKLGSTKLMNRLLLWLPMCSNFLMFSLFMSPCLLFLKILAVTCLGEAGRGEEGVCGINYKDPPLRTWCSKVKIVQSFVLNNENFGSLQGFSKTFLGVTRKNVSCHKEMKCSVFTGFVKSVHRTILEIAKWMVSEIGLWQLL